VTPAVSTPGETPTAVRGPQSQTVKGSTAAAVRWGTEAAAGTGCGRQEEAASPRGPSERKRHDHMSWKKRAHSHRAPTGRMGKVPRRRGTYGGRVADRAPAADRFAIGGEEGEPTVDGKVASLRPADGEQGVSAGGGACGAAAGDEEGGGTVDGRWCRQRHHRGGAVAAAAINAGGGGGLQPPARGRAAAASAHVPAGASTAPHPPRSRVRSSGGRRKGGAAASGENGRGENMTGVKCFVIIIRWQVAGGSLARSSFTLSTFIIDRSARIVHQLYTHTPYRLMFLAHQSYCS
jgi:hypothetical protein